MNNIRIARAFDAHLMDFQARKEYYKSMPDSRGGKSPIERVIEE